MKKLAKYIDVSPEVASAIAANKPVVALESTIISHGMPYPQNVEMAKKTDQIIRDNGATPATIAIIGGKLKVGLSDSEIEYIGKKGSAVSKVSRRDLPLIIASKGDGATTVAATMIIANMAGIGVFATGGIGGVHRGAATSMDISADLDELSKTPVLVVCAGAKSILDLGLTLEYLETKGVAIIGYKTEYLPAFYIKTSDFKVTHTLSSTHEIASAFAASKELNLGTGMVVANPIPDEHSFDKATIDSAIDQALADAKSQGITGKDSTPFLLDAVKNITQGKSLEANIELMYNNAKVAAEIAVEYAKL